MAKKKAIVTEIRETRYEHIELLELPDNAEKIVFTREDGGKIYCLYHEFLNFKNHRYALWISEPQWKSHFLVNNMFSTFLELSLYAQLQHERSCNL